jgi:membrane protein
MTATDSNQSTGLRRAFRFVRDGIWDVEPSSLPFPARQGVKLLRVLQLVAKGFREDDCTLQASALTLSTLMAIVPILALSLSIARGLGGADTARVKVKELVEQWTSTLEAGPIIAIGSTNAVPLSGPGSLGDTLGQEINRRVDDAFERVDKINFAALGGVGLVLLVFMVVQVLAQVESSFNRVWGVTVGRSLWRRFTDYLSVLFIVPFLVIAASTLPALGKISHALGHAGGAHAATGSGFLHYLTSTVIMSTAFTCFFIFMPNTKVRLVSGTVGGTVTGVMFVAWLWLCAAMQVSVANYSRIYGSFAIVPILLAWLYMSWQIVLFGAEVSFAIQNHATYRMESGARRASAEARVTMALAVTLEAARSMTQGSGGFNASAFAAGRSISVRFLNEIVDELINARILAAVSGGESRYVLLQTPETLTAGQVIDAVLQSGVKSEALGLAPLQPEVAGALARFTRGVGDSLGRVTVAELLKGGGA